MTSRCALFVLLCGVLGCTPAPAPMFDTGGDDAGHVAIDAASPADGGRDAAVTLADVGSDARALDASSADAALDAGSDAATPAPEHVVISEIVVAPAAAEYFEIWNPTSAAVDLTDYYVSDNAVYAGIATATAWNPPTANPGTDFLIRFPAGLMIGPNAVLTVALNDTFETTFSRCPDLIADTTPLACTGGTAPSMLVPTNGGLDPTKRGTLLSDAREMLVLFRWAAPDTIVHDVDYVTWGSSFDAGQTRADKTALPGYLPDTAAASQRAATAPPSGQSIVRCGGEIGETETGGNGITGHDETSEHLDVSFGVLTTPTPGVRGTCS